ncbi:glycoside hydrolase family 28 protein [Lachnotalea sp. AF33-28]|uniref:glycoside hydrolase family 28 protein n=1 Tax=Lachnotalea sp. AF33-28 TaxID=2292046 RepID=UPI001FAAC234|nr:glycosyl hydrolase family 28 protein [Lachnotalea sp. AF33-28]
MERKEENGMSVHNIIDYGASTGKENNAPFIQRAVNAACEEGGGTVSVPAGEYLCGHIELKSHVNLHLDQGAVLKCSLKKEDFLQEGADTDELELNSGCFIGARHAEDISITGRGVIDGQGRLILKDDGADNGAGECPLNFSGFRTRMTLLEDVTDLTIEGVTFRDSALWTLHMAGCRRVMIRGIRILNNVRGANNDGIDPDSCQDVVISDCIIKTGDDAIVVKTTKPMTEKYGPCQNVVIKGCVLHSHDSALKIGTETHGDIRNIILSDCVIEDCSRAVGIWVRDGGTVENIQIHHLTGAVRRYANAGGRDFAPDWWGKGEPVFLSNTRRKGSQEFTGRICGVSFDHIRIASESCIFLAADDGCPVQDITICDMEMTMCRQGTQAGGLFDEQPSERNVYAHSIPALYARGIHGLTVKNWRVKRLEPAMKEWDGFIVTENCTQCRFENAEEA